MKKILTSIGLIASLVFTGLMAAAPAQAVAGSQVKFGSRDRGIPSSVKLKTIKTNGVVVWQDVGSLVTDVFQVCPPSISYKLEIVPITGSGWYGAAGQCYAPPRAIWYGARLRLL
ncbi:hypothetical protein HLB23_25470 [Nocardia uniformis]|uniref:Uncharacterized protein n=1 Tax=Nocardia uniformis TaxID=53432 RepID=A0A849CA45_9NOCA|nr:hypothetical protein [Nocardia uniformis]NNH73165.1 hypothetical protein [Nocardia uniformis]